MWQVLKELILAIFYPHYCPACHEEVEGPGLLCEACRRSTYAPGYLELKKETVPLKCTLFTGHPVRRVHFKKPSVLF